MIKDNNKIPKMIEDISSEWVTKAPFFAEFLMKFRYQETEGNMIGVSMHNQYITLKWGTKFFDKHTIDDVKFIIVHEILHIVKNHFGRFDTFNWNKSDTFTYNIASDIVINEEIIATIAINDRVLSPPVALDENGKPFREGVFKDNIPEYSGKLVTEEIMKYLLMKFPEGLASDEEQNKEDQSSGQGLGQGLGGDDGSTSPNCGEQQGGNEVSSFSNALTQDNMFDMSSIMNQIQEENKSKEDFVEETLADLDSRRFDSHDGHDSLETEDAAIIIGDIIETAYSRGFGSISNDAAMMIKGLKRPVQLPIRSILRNHLYMNINSHQGRKVETWSRQNRRGNPLLPGKKRQTVPINIVIDTSGSLFSEAAFTTFFTEIDNLSKKFPDMQIIQFDTEVKDVSSYKRGQWKRMDMKGRGGTSVQCVFDYLKKKKQTKVPTIVFTDGEFYWGFKNYGVKPLWVIDTPNHKYNHKDNHGSYFNINKKWR